MVGLAEDTISRIRAAAAEAIARYRVPGIAIGVVRPEGLIYSEGFGYLDIESRTPTGLEHRHCIASVTKTMVGLCVLALVDEGRLRLSDRVVDRLPDVRFEGPGELITIWHLLTHTAGIGEAPTPDVLTAVVNPDADARRKPGDFVSLFADGVQIECEPGTKWHYANYGYNLLGEIVTRAEQAPLQEVLRRRIFRPLGMGDSDLLGQDHPRLSTPYHRAPTADALVQFERAGVNVPEEHPVDGVNIRGRFRGEFNSAALASGGVQSTLPDMAQYAAALLRNGGGVVGPETFAAMIGPQYCPDARLSNWGLSFSRVPMFGRTFIGHGGAYFGGWNTNLSFLPDEGIAVIQHMNVMLEGAALVYARILAAVLGVDGEAMPEDALTTDPAILESAPGLYELAPGRLTNFRPATRLGRITIEQDGAGLALRSRWGPWKHGVPMRRVDPAEPTVFRVGAPGDESPLVILTRDARGRVDGLRTNELIHMVRADRAS